MKQKVWLLSLALLLLLGACGNRAGEKETAATSTSSENSSEEIETKMEEKASYTGVLLEAPEVTDDGIRFALSEVSPENDAEELASIGEEGVVLNADQKTVADAASVSEWKKGDTLRFTVQTPVVMTRSIPPQIPGQIITAVERLN